MDKHAIVATFLKYFYVTRATTVEQLQAAYRIRYRVYCQEFQFEPEQNYPEQEEHDDYDQQSLQCLLVHKPSGIAVGCMRLILPNPIDPKLPLPFERFCKHSLNPNIVDLNTFDRRYLGEFSRLAIIAQFRRRQSDEKQRISLPDPGMVGIGRDTFPVISLSLVLAGIILFTTSELQHAFAMMEPGLAQGLGRYGINFIQIGNAVDYHGFRGPFMLPKRSALSHLTTDLQPLLGIISQQMSRFSENRIQTGT